jgi:PAS domain S-box-containing protein
MTERKRSEKKLRQERNRAQMYLDIAGVMIVAMNAKGEVTLINRKGSAILGYEQAEIIGRVWFENFVPARLRDQVRTAFDSLMAGQVEPVEYYENPVVTETGEERIIAWHNTILKDSEGHIVGTLSSGEDITERKQSEEVLESQHRLMSTLLDNLQVGVFMVEAPTGKPLLANKRAKQLLGRGIMADADKTVLAEVYNAYKLGTDEPYPTDQLPIVRGLRGESHTVDDMVVVRPDNSRVLLEVFGSPVQDNQGKVMASLVSFSDVTERKRAEAERIRLNADLAAKNVELEQVVYVASHDLRSPLVNIDGYSKELEYAIQDLREALAGASAETRTAVASLLEQDIPEALRFIRASASKMDTLLTGLLRLSRSGRATLTMETLDMNGLIGNVINSIEFQIKEAGVKLEVADLPPCHSDAVQVNQIFSNLVSNGLKYLDPGRPGIIRITGRAEGERSVYCVEDNGIGIAPAHLDKIFEIFHRLDPAHSEGEGLGLTIIKRIVGRLEGSIWVESNPGSGSRFCVALPAGRSQRDTE